MLAVGGDSHLCKKRVEAERAVGFQLKQGFQIDAVCSLISERDPELVTTWLNESLDNRS